MNRDQRGFDDEADVKQLNDDEPGGQPTAPHGGMLDD